MNRLFFRFFVLVMLAITAAAFAIHFAISRLYGDPLEEIARKQAAAQIFLLQHYIDQAPADEWLVRLNKVREVSPQHYELLPLADARSRLPAGRHAALERGDIVLDVAAKSFYRRVDSDGERYIGSDGDVILAQALPIDTGQALQQEALRYAIVALALLIPIALWSRAHWQGLQTLSRTADRIGAGDLAARTAMRSSASIYPLAERMNAMADRIQQLMDAQRNLLHSVSHEVRTPIARLEFGLELLRAAAADPALETRIAGMEQDLRELNALVGELLGMARLDSGQAMQRTPFALAPMLRHCAAQCGGLADAEDGEGTASGPDAGMDAGTRVGTYAGMDSGTRAGPDASQPRLTVSLADDLGSLDGDSRLLQRAVDNLLSNARKYAASRVLLSAVRKDGMVEIAVQDDGPGIPAAERERVFEPFYRLDRSRDRASGGFGLGLSIAHKAVALHGGTLRAEDSTLDATGEGTGIGARLVIRLPG